MQYCHALKKSYFLFVYVLIWNKSIFSSYCMYFLCRATERQHSTNTGAYVWFLGFHAGESFHWLSFVLISNITHNHASPDKWICHLEPYVYFPKSSFFINYL